MQFSSPNLATCFVVIFYELYFCVMSDKSTYENAATLFGKYLDEDNFEQMQKLLDEDCVYEIAGEILLGPSAISASYENNMLEGRKKLDSLIWGQSEIEPVSENAFLVHFTDYLIHRGLKHTHCCSQKVMVNDHGRIIKIEHLDNPRESEELQNFYRRVGLPTSH